MKMGLAIVLFFVMTSFPAVVSAEIEPQEVSGRLAGNYAKLREYSWSTRSEVRLQGQQISVTLEKIRYDLKGDLQITPLGGSGKLSPELQPVVNELAKLGLAYAQPEPKAFERFFQQAEIWESRRGAGTVRVEGEGFLQQGDYVDLRGRNQRAERLRVESIFGGATPVTIDADYRSLPNDGPSYVARLEINVPENDLDILIENFDHTYNAPVAASDIVTISEGTELQVRLTAPLSSKQARGGDQFELLLDRDILVNNNPALKPGTALTGEVVDAKAAGRAQGKGSMAIRLVSLVADNQTFSIETNTLNFEAEGTGRKTGRRIAGGAGVGAMIGAIAGGGSGAWKGAAIGAGVGTGATLLTKGNEVEFPAEQLFSFTLTEAVKITQ